MENWTPFYTGRFDLHLVTSVHYDFRHLKGFPAKVTLQRELNQHMNAQLLSQNPRHHFLVEQQGNSYEDWYVNGAYTATQFTNQVVDHTSGGVTRHYLRYVITKEADLTLAAARVNANKAQNLVNPATIHDIAGADPAPLIPFVNYHPFAQISGSIVSLLFAWCTYENVLRYTIFAYYEISPAELATVKPFLDADNSRIEILVELWKKNSDLFELEKEAFLADVSRRFVKVKKEEV